MFQEQMSQGLGIGATPVYPQTLNNSSQNTTGVDMSKCSRVMFVVIVGSLTGGGNLKAKLQSSATVGGSYADISGGAITDIAAGSRIATLEIRSQEVPATQPFVRCLLTESGSQNVVCACLPLLGDAPQKPVSAQDIAAVIQRLVV